MASAICRAVSKRLSGSRDSARSVTRSSASGIPAAKALGGSTLPSITLVTVSPSFSPGNSRRKVRASQRTTPAA